MKYLPTLNLWNVGIHTAIVTGQLKLLSGQWVQCGEGMKSRFISVNNGVINAVHWSGTAKRTHSKYLLRARLNRLNVAREAGTMTSTACWLAAKELLNG